MLFIETSEPLESWLVGTQITSLRHSCEQPKCFFLIASVNHQYEPNYEVYALTVTYFFVVDRKHLERVHECFLANISILFFIEKWMNWKGPVEVFQYIMQPFALRAFS